MVRVADLSPLSCSGDAASRRLSASASHVSDISTPLRCTLTVLLGQTQQAHTRVLRQTWHVTSTRVCVLQSFCRARPLEIIPAPLAWKSWPSLHQFTCAPGVLVRPLASTCQCTSMREFVCLSFVVSTFRCKQTFPSLVNASHCRFCGGLPTRNCSSCPSEDFAIIRSGCVPIAEGLGWASPFFVPSDNTQLGVTSQPLVLAHLQDVGVAQVCSCGSSCCEHANKVNAHNTPPPNALTSQPCAESAVCASKPSSLIAHNLGPSAVPCKARKCVSLSDSDIHHCCWYGSPHFLLTGSISLMAPVSCSATNCCHGMIASCAGMPWNCS